jgi:cob(I)alamin adenosyltransferase
VLSWITVKGAAVMHMEFDKVTTRGGDRGDSSLYNGDRLSKDDLLFEALGDLDELVSCLVLLRAGISHAGYRKDLFAVQKRLFLLGSQIATPSSDPLYKSLVVLGQKDIEFLERLEKKIMEVTKIESAFVIPGENEASARADLARAVTRRLERRIVGCIRKRGMIELADGQRFVNRLSDYLFVLARTLS